MTRSTTLTRVTTFVLSAVAAALFVVLCTAFGDGLLKGPIWNPARWLDSPLITYLLLALILAVGLIQAHRLPADGLVLRFPHDDWTPGQTEEPQSAIPPGWTRGRRCMPFGTTPSPPTPAARARSPTTGTGRSCASWTTRGGACGSPS